MIFGLILLYAFLWSLPKLMLVLGYITEVFVGLPVPDREYIPKIEGTFFTKAFNALKDKRIGKSLVYTLFLAIPYGTFTFTIMVFLLALSGALIALPIVYLVQYLIHGLGFINEWWEVWIYNHIDLWVIILILVVAGLIGLFLIPAVLQVSNKLAIWHARMVQKALER